VEVALDPDIDRVYPERYANRVEIVLRDGRRFETRVDYAKGSTGQPLSLLEVAGKFRSLAGGVLSPAQADQIVATVGDLEQIDDIRDLTRLLA
jgi:2-methylcitrate dehydratase PrpD